jgi:hypothetical protein
LNPLDKFLKSLINNRLCGGTVSLKVRYWWTRRTILWFLVFAFVQTHQLFILTISESELSRSKQRWGEGLLEPRECRWALMAAAVSNAIVTCAVEEHSPAIDPAFADTGCVTAVAAS